MMLKELLPILRKNAVCINERTLYGGRFILVINPETTKKYIADELLNREVVSIDINRDGMFNIYVGKKKDEDEEV